MWRECDCMGEDALHNKRGESGDNVHARDVKAKRYFPEAYENVQNQEKRQRGLQGVQTIPLRVGGDGQRSASDEKQRYSHPDAKKATRGRMGGR